MRKILIPLLLGAAFLSVSPAVSGQQKKPQGDTGGGDAPGASSVRAAPLKGGEAIYTAVCQACHMADAKGGQGAATIPSLANNPRLAQPAYPIVMVARGRGAMPGLTDLLTPAQVGEVVGYVRTHFGNSYPGNVTAEDVLKVTGPFPKPQQGH